MQVITVLGATGSIGVNTLDVIARHPDLFDVFALTAHSQVALLAKQCIQFNPRFAVIGCELKAKELRLALSGAGCETEVLFGARSLVDVAKDPAVDSVMAAIVGAAGLMPTFAAVNSGKRVMLANKESLVMSGAIFMDAAKRAGATILPTDSEHNAIYQALPQPVSAASFASANNSLRARGVEKIILTGSGGPFRQADVASLTDVTPEQACAHPNWCMGKKISVDSATMMNKGLEFIEACWLFNANPCDIEIVIHPQSIIHSMVRYIDGSVVAQLGQPDMRTPIAYCLGWPSRIDAGVTPLDFKTLANLEFSAPDHVRFPALKASTDAITHGGSLPVALNAANEIAVEAFLARGIKFTQIAETIDRVLQSWGQPEPTSIEMVLDADSIARQRAREYIANAQ